MLPFGIVLLVVLLCALLTIAISGQQAGQNNNLFHMPILERLYDRPQFADDQYMQSLRHYASGFWLLLTGALRLPAALELFLPLAIMSRVLFFAGVLMLARPLGIVGRKTQCIFLLLVALSPLLRGFSAAGGGGMFINEFTHSELANATMLMALALAARQRFTAAIAVAGVTFFINIFMAVWLAVPVVLLMALALQRGAITFARLLRQTGWGVLACVPLVAPILLNVSANPDFGRAIAFDYRLFLLEYWPNHFLIGEIPLREIAKLLLAVAAGVAASLLLDRDERRTALAILAGFLAIWILGTIAPSLTSSPTVLNLHLLRSSALLLIMAGMILAAAATRLILSGNRADRLVWAPLWIVATLLKPALLPLVFVVMAARVLWPLDAWKPRLAAPALAIAAFGALGVANAVEIATTVHDDSVFRQNQREWIALARWAETASVPTDIFLLPVVNFRSSGPLPGTDPAAEQLLAGSAVFSPIAERRIWIGFKEGAAVMWTPGYHDEWRRRLIETLPLADLPSRIDYARRHGIAMVVDSCEQRGYGTPVYRSGRLCVHAATTKSRL